MKKRFLLFGLLFAATIAAHASDKTAQDTTKAAAPDPPLAISGSVDTYFKYDFSGHGNIPTSFATDENSVSIGMIDLGLKKKVGKASFVGELSFGPRGQEQSLPDASGSTLPAGVSNYHIQNLYVSYDLTDKFNVTGGYMSTFIGYEVISPTGNFNYSTSYLFTNGPFQNAGLKATYTFSDRASLMAGIFNDAWNLYSSVKKVNTFGAQLMVVPVKNWTAYINLATGAYSGTEIDLTTNYQITSAFKLGLNAADYSAPNSAGGFTGVALYPQLAVCSSVTLGVRGEYFKAKDGTYNAIGAQAGQHVTGLTFTANVKAGPLTLIPELRFDSNSMPVFLDSNAGSTKSATQVLLAAVYAF